MLGATSPSTLIDTRTTSSCSSLGSPPPTPSLVPTPRGLRRGALRRLRRGMTLLEIVIVLAIVLIMTSIGIGMSSDVIPRYRTRKAAMTFSAKVQECRALAVRSGRECMIWLRDPDSDPTNLSQNTGVYWVALGDSRMDSTGWDYLPVDEGGDTDASQGQVDIGNSDSSDYARHVGLAEWPSIGGPGVGNDNRIIFDSRGFVKNPASDFDGYGYITVTFMNKVVRAAGLNEDYTVSISKAGMVRVDSTAANEFATAGVPT